MKRFFLPAWLCLLLYLPGHGQENKEDLVAPIATDRPDQTESAQLVPDGYWQMELGFGKVNHEQGHSYIYPNILLKYGVNEHFELRLITSYASIQEQGKENINGFLPFAIGFKTKITEEDGIWPKVSLLAHFVIPGIVNDRLATDHLAADMRFAFAHSISDVFSLGYNLGVFWNGTAPEPTFIYSLAPGMSFGRFGFYIEGYGFVFTGNTSDLAVLADGGMTYLVNNDLQLDLSLGQNLTNNVIENYIALGVSLRLH